MINIILTITNISSIVVLNLFYKRKLKKVKESIVECEIPIKYNNMLKNILEVCFIKKTLPASCYEIIKSIKNTYEVDYVTLFTIKENQLQIVSSDIEDTKTREDVTMYYKSMINEMFENKAIITCSLDNNILNYIGAKSRKIIYSYFIPLENNCSEKIGALLIENKNNVEDKDWEDEFFLVIKNSIAITLQNLLYYNEITEMSIKDGLTKVYNRRYMDSFLKERLEDNVKVFSIVMMDLDYFKKFNDIYGHAFGDLTLIEITQLISNNIKDNGEIFRYGGEEFLMYFENCSAADCYKKIEKIRILIESYILTDGSIRTSITSSFGIAEYNSFKHKNIETLIKDADTALYSSKNTGRNKITIFSS